jgi:hypothetical protein
MSYSDKSIYQLTATKILRVLNVFRSTAEEFPTTPTN